MKAKVSNRTKFFGSEDNPKPKFPFDDDPIENPDADEACAICKMMISNHSVRELVSCALNELRGVKV